MYYNVLFHSFCPSEEVYNRCDVAHMIKAFTSLTSIRSEKLRTKKLYVRSLSKLVLCTNIAVAKEILTAIFIAAQSETDGYVNGVATTLN